MSSKTLGQLMTENGIPIKCWNCDYVWNYTGDKERATCPSCSRKNKVNEQRIDREK